MSHRLCGVVKNKIYRRQERHLLPFQAVEWQDRAETKQLKNVYNASCMRHITEKTKQIILQRDKIINDCQIMLRLRIGLLRPTYGVF